MNFGKIKWTIYGLFFIVIGIVISVYGIRDVKDSKKKPVDITAPGFDWNDLEEGDHVVSDVDFLLGYFMYETDDDSGKHNMRIYAMPHLDEQEDMIFIDNYIGLDVNGNSDDSFSDYDRVVEDSLEWWRSDEFTRDIDPVHIDGIVCKMDAKKISYFEDFLDDAGVDKSAVRDSMYEYYIVPVGKHNTFVIIFGIVITLAGIATTFFTLVRKRIK